MSQKYVLGVLCAAGFVSAVHAQFGPGGSSAATAPPTITVEVRNSGGIETSQLLSTGQAWTHTITSSTNRINILASSSTANIGRLTFNGGNGQPVMVILGDNTALGSGGVPSDIVANDWAGLDTTTGGSAVFQLYGAIGGDLTGSILVDELDRFDAKTGEIQALIQADDAFEDFFAVFADSVSIGGSIECVNGTIDHVETTGDCSGAIDAAVDINVIQIGGDMLYHVTAGERIGNITVTGTIGSATRNAEITTTDHVGAYIGSGPFANAHAIQSITAATMYADITTPSASATERGDIGTITTNGTGGAPAGDFYGSINTFAMQRENETETILDIAGHLYADIQTETIKRPIDIGGDLKSGATITMTSGSKKLGNINIDGALAGTIDFPGVDDIPNNIDLKYNADIVVGSISSTGQILVSNDMTGSIKCTGIMAGFINIDGKLERDDTRTGVFGIDIDATPGLTGQIIINSADNGGTWVDDVVVGSATLSPKGTYLQIGLGGGAVGLVGFDLHLEDCDPPADASTNAVLNSSTFEVTLVHYGPVTWLNDEIPLKIMYKQIVPDLPEVDVSLDFEITSPQDQRPMVLEPKSGITPGDGKYTITPLLTVRCEDTTELLPYVASWTYVLDFNN